MAKGLYQKCKLLYLKQIFEEQTDEQHKLTLAQIQEKLHAYDIEADRKTLYDDFDMLRYYGLDIQGDKDHGHVVYYLASREFEISELKLLVDAVQSSKFITQKRSNDLIKKLESLTNVYEAGKLHRQVINTGGIKTINKEAYTSIDRIHEAIASNKQISFKYFYIDANKERVLKKDGGYYYVSPWIILWDDENYYLVAYDMEAEKIKHYRVDKMLDVKIVDAKREGKEIFRNEDYASYSTKHFSMFGGEEQDVEIEFSNSLSGVAIDRFGNDIRFKPGSDADHFKITVSVVVSKQFFGWLISFGENAKLLGPPNVVRDLKDEITQQIKKYM